ncbi:MAG: hypothetical protein AB7K52_05010 [Phycisphaerales bacterium]
MSQIGPTTMLQLPTDLAARLNTAASAMGVDLATYLIFLEQCRAGRLDHTAQDATRFMLAKHDASLRKLAQ